MKNTFSISQPTLNKGKVSQTFNYFLGCFCCFLLFQIYLQSNSFTYKIHFKCFFRLSQSTRLTQIFINLFAICHVQIFPMYQVHSVLGCVFICLSHCPSITTLQLPVPGTNWDTSHCNVYIGNCGFVGSSNQNLTHHICVLVVSILELSVL